MKSIYVQFNVSIYVQLSLKKGGTNKYIITRFTQNRPKKAKNV